MLSKELLDDCKSKWLKLNNIEKYKWSLKAEGTKLNGYNAFMNDCIAIKQTEKTQNNGKKCINNSTNQMRWLGLFMGKP